MCEFLNAARAHVPNKGAGLKLASSQTKESTLKAETLRPPDPMDPRVKSNVVPTSNRRNSAHTVVTSIFETINGKADERMTCKAQGFLRTQLQFTRERCFDKRIRNLFETLYRLQAYSFVEI